ncbi:MAG TPA: hypothetical protein VHG69_05525 [Thermoleophilaceae bacterium]|nr:hypothetical protein [Thermoleophilaceae bacterium]
MPDEVHQEGLSRRALMQRAGLATAGAALAQLPWALDAKGLLEEARAQSADLTEDTLNGLVAFVTPGDDPYSRQQGEATDRPGGIASGVTPVLIASLNRYVRASALGAFGGSVPAAAGVAALLNHYAVQASPVAIGPFVSHFARLGKPQKADVFRRWEGDPAWENSEMRAVSAVLIGYTAYLTWSEAGVFDRTRRAPMHRPVGWTLSGYGGRAEGRRELKGYYKGRRRARGRRRRRRRRRA